MGKLTPFGVKHAKPGRHADGDGLYLLVKESGAKSWLLRIQIDGKRRDFGLGSCSMVSLAEAREKARGLRKGVHEGVDPVAQKRARKALPNFKEAAISCHKALNPAWTKRHALQWLTSLDDHVFPKLGSVRVDRVDASLVADALERSWHEVPNTARRVLQRVGTVLDYSCAKRWRTADNPLRSVRHLLPGHNDRPKHFEAVPYDSLSILMAKLCTSPPSVGRLATAFTILTASRPNEVRLMVWSEVNLERAVWSIPAERMKMRKLHEVPLSAPALDILEKLAGLFGVKADGLVFPGRGNKAMSAMTMVRSLREIGCSATVHGTARSSFSDWANEMTQSKKAVIESALAHDNPDRTEAAYRRTTFFDQRVRLMDMWGAWVTSTKQHGETSSSVAEGHSASSPDLAPQSHREKLTAGA